MMFEGLSHHAQLVGVELRDDPQMEDRRHDGCSLNSARGAEAELLSSDEN